MVRRQHRDFGHRLEGVHVHRRGEDLLCRVRLADQLGVAHLVLRVHDQEIIVVVQLEDTLEVAVRPAAQRGGQLLAGMLGALGPRHFREAAGEQQFGFVVEGAQQLALPAVPDPRPDAADVADRQYEEHL